MRNGNANSRLTTQKNTLSILMLLLGTRLTKSQPLSFARPF